MDELKYRVISTHDRNESIMWDTLLTRILECEAFHVYKKKGEKTWRFHFWMTDEEYDWVTSLIESAKAEEWDEEYERLLTERS